jgi:HSP20 family protein
MGTSSRERSSTKGVQGRSTRERSEAGSADPLPLADPRNAERPIRGRGRTESKGGASQVAMRWDPFRDLMSIQSELNRLFGRTYAGASEGASPAGAWVPPLDIFETPEKFVVTVELPGVSPESVDLSVEDSTLTIRGERDFYRDVPEEAFHRVERRYGPFARSLSLPQTADPERIEASFDRGVLTIEVPKAELAKPKKIAIKARDEGIG